MDQINRITLMEKYLNNGIDAVAQLESALANYEDVLNQINTLFQYYGSATWFKDFEDDRADKLPEDLNRGVLSEDGIFNFMTENRELLDKMKTFTVESEIKIFNK